MVRDGSLEWFYGHGVADIATNTPVTEDTVFRIDVRNPRLWVTSAPVVGAAALVASRLAAHVR